MNRLLRTLFYAFLFTFSFHTAHADSFYASVDIVEGSQIIENSETGNQAP